MQCVNLKQRFGDRYKVQFEESYRAERPEFRQQEVVWLMTIACENGHVSPWGGRLLAASTNKAGPVANKLKRLPFVQTAQDGEDGATVVFDIQHFDELAAVMKPRRRRQGRRLSDEERQRLVEAGAKYRFRTGRKTPDSAPESQVRAQAV